MNKRGFLASVIQELRQGGDTNFTEERDMKTTSTAGTSPKHFLNAIHLISIHNSHLSSLPVP